MLNKRVPPLARTSAVDFSPIPNKIFSVFFLFFLNSNIFIFHFFYFSATKLDLRQKEKKTRRFNGTQNKIEIIFYFYLLYKSKPKMASYKPTLVFFNGSPLELVMPMSNLTQCGEEWILAGFKDGRTLKEMGDDCLKTMKEREKQCFDAFGNRGVSLRDYAKVWGKDYAQKCAEWCIFVYVLIKLKYIKDDDMNGFQTLDFDGANIKDLRKAGIVSTKQILNTCVVCATEGAFKKCSGCKKDYYCGAECQKADWKRHKAQHHA
jgi:hypothetical protein